MELSMDADKIEEKTAWRLLNAYDCHGTQLRSSLGLTRVLVGYRPLHETQTMWSMSQLRALRVSA
jgi:hypothetical protein